MEGLRAIARIVGSFFVAYGVLILYLLSSRVGRLVTEGARGLLPTYDVSSTGYSFSTGQLPLLIQLVLLIPAGVLLAWKLRRWAAIVGIIGVLILPATSLTLQFLVSTSGGPPITELIDVSEIVIGPGIFVGLPVLGTVLAWRKLR